MASKMIIDATRQLPSEGGPAERPAISRARLKQGCPEVIDLVQQRWEDYWRDWPA